MVDDVNSDELGAPAAVRRRSFVAGSVRPPLPTSRAETLPELPVLTEVVEVVEPQPAVPAVPAIDPEQVATMARAMLAELLPVRQQQAADVLGAWLDSDLPQIVLRVLDGLSDHIVAQVTADVRASLLPALQAALEEDGPADGSAP